MIRLFAKKSLGQNFLISPRVVDAIAKAGELSPGDLVVEVGPGKGVLTKALLATGARVIAIEKDDRLAPLLRAEFEKEIAEGRFELIHGDVLESFDMLAQKIGSSYQVIANIPYYITGALIRRFLSAPQKPSAMILMVQKEVADRIIARDGKESILSISVKAFAAPSLVMNVSRGNFFPAPNVDSAVIKLSEIHNPFADAAEEERFFEIVKAGFAQKRKKLSSNLTATIEKEKIEKAFADLCLDGNIRAEDLKLADWIALSKRA
jgi:16S rRNA (adenine1518-N6/adenine1519-N6)-dimethyltransferase